MSTRTLPAPLQIPNTSYGPFRLLAPVPWLLLATVFRQLATHGGIGGLAALVVSTVALFIAFLLAARRTIEYADGRTSLGHLSFAEQMRLARRILGRVLVLMVLGWVALGLLTSPQYGASMMHGIDGIAFDQHGLPQMAWSSVIATIVLIMVIQAGAAMPVSLPAALREFATRGRVLLPAIAILTLFYVVLSFIQDHVRGPLFVFLKTSDHSQTLKNLIYYGYLLSFSALRLWSALAILTFALRESYRRGEQP